MALAWAFTIPFLPTVSAYHILVAVLLFFILQWFFQRKQYNKVYANWPLLGSFPVLAWNSYKIHEWMTEVFIKLGTNSFYLKGPVLSKLDYLVTCDPQNLEHIFKTNVANYPKGKNFMQIFEILGEGIFNADSESWQTQRKSAHWAFRSVDFRSFVNSTVQKAIQNKLLPVLANVAKEGCPVDLQDLFLRYTFDTINITISGKDLGCLAEGLPTNVVATAVDDAQEAVIYRVLTPTFYWKLLRLLKVGTEKKLAKAREVADNTIYDIIWRKKEEVLKGVESETNSLLSTYIRSQGEKPDWSEARVKFLRDTVLNFFLAGRDTTASGLLWFFWSLNRNPRVEAKLLEELRFVFSQRERKGEVNAVGKKKFMFEPDDLKNLLYLHAAFCETLRLFPPVPLNRKGVVKKDVLPDGSVVKPGMQVLLGVYSLARIPSIWGEDCLEFKPERWIKADGTLDNDMISKLLFAFGGGPRICIGRDMAFTNMKLAAAAILSNFHIQVEDDHPVSLKSTVVLQVNDGLMVHVKERSLF